MARVSQYTRPMDEVITKLNFSQISILNSGEIMIKQEPYDTNNITMNDNSVSTNTQCEYIDLTENDNSEEENVPSRTKNFSNDVITNQIRMKSISIGNAMIENSKDVQQRIPIDENNKNDETLEKSNNSDIFNNSQYKWQCDICFLSFISDRSLFLHKNGYLMYTNKYVCKRCSSTTCDHVKKRHSKKMPPALTCKCFFCEKWFHTKARLQGHLFHFHIEEINGMNVVENDILVSNNSTVSHCVTPIENNAKQQNKGNEKEKEGMIDENTHNSEANMCELLTTIKQEIELRDDQVNELPVDQIVSNVSEAINKPKEKTMNNQPFVKIYVDQNMMEALLGSSDDSFHNKSLSYNSNNNNNNNSNNRSNNSIISKPYALRSLNNSKNDNSITSPKIVQKNNQSNDKLSKHLKACKKCIIPLVKCDSIINVTTPTRLTLNSLQSNTLLSQISQSPLKCKFIEHRLTSRKRKSTMSETSHNCTPQMNHSKELIVNDVSIEEPPMKIMRSEIIHMPSDLSLNDSTICYKTKKRTRRGHTIKRQSVINRSMFLQKLRTRREDNKNSAVSQTVEKFDTKKLEDKEFANNNIKLKEVKVSLIKLPDIKKEIIMPINIANEIIPKETFHCSICDLLFTSKKKLKKHIKKCHTAYTSSICPAKYSSKRLLLKHYLNEHCALSNKCCVCYKFLISRLSLKKHLFLHCIKITLSKNDRSVSNENFKCNLRKSSKCKPTGVKIILRMSGLSKKHLKINHGDNNYDVRSTKHGEIDNNDMNNKEKQTEYQEIDNGENDQEKKIEPEEIDNDKNNQEKSTEFEDIYIDNDDDNVQKIPEDNLNENNAENMINQVSESNENVDADVFRTEKEPQTGPIICINLKEPLESNNTEVFLSGNAIEEPILDPLQDVAPIFSICNPKKNLQTELSLNTSNSIQPSVNDSNNPVHVTEIITKEKNYQCSICKQRFQKFENLQQHIRYYNPSINNCCVDCGIFFSSKKTLSNHINSTHNLAISNLYKLRCQFCNQGFRNQNNLYIHELHYHATVLTINNIKFTDLLQISNGEDNQSIQRFCNVCGLLFNTVERYQLHCMYFNKDHIFPCNFCNKIFHGLYMIHRHNKLFHFSGDTSSFYKYKCKICHDGFASEIHLQTHMLHVHPEAQVKSICCDQNKSYVCSICNMKFFTVIELLMHIEHFSNDGKYKCTKCSRKCCTSLILNDHMYLTHLDNGLTTKHICGICNEVLISETFLLCHQKHIHDNLENEQIVSTIPYQYPETDDLHVDDITDKDALITSNKSVTFIDSPNSSFITVKKYHFCCSICAVRFEKEIHLKEHLAEYLNYGDYQCKTCQRRFVNSDFLKKHVKNHLVLGMPRSKYYCIICNEVCNSSIILESHVAHLHGCIIFNNVSSKND